MPQLGCFSSVEEPTFKSQVSCSGQWQGRLTGVDRWNEFRLASLVHGKRCTLLRIAHNLSVHLHPVSLPPGAGLVATCSWGGSIGTEQRHSCAIVATSSHPWPQCMPLLIRACYHIKLQAPTKGLLFLSIPCCPVSASQARSVPTVQICIDAGNLLHKCVPSWLRVLRIALFCLPGCEQRLAIQQQLSASPLYRFSLC